MFQTVPTYNALPTRSNELWFGKSTTKRYWMLSFSFHRYTYLVSIEVITRCVATVEDTLLCV